MQETPIKAVFLDRDGVINNEVNYLHKISDFSYTYKCIDGLKIFIALGYRLVVVTNQAGIAKGKFELEDYFSLTNFYKEDLLKNGIELLDIFYCPHHIEATTTKYKKNCNNRKPNTGMILDAKAKYNINLEKSILIGDQGSDIEAGLNSNIKKCYLVESGHPLKQDYYKKYKVFKNLYEVAKYEQYKNK